MEAESPFQPSLHSHKAKTFSIRKTTSGGLAQPAPPLWH